MVEIAMRRAQGSTTVVAMTIAEVFLLLMFVMWLGAVIKGQAGKGQVDAAILQRRLDETTKELAEANKQIGELKATVEALRIMLGANSVDPEELKRALEKKIADAVEGAKRGKPKCAEENVLVEARVLDGVSQVAIVAQNGGTLDWLKKAGIRSAASGYVMTDLEIPMLIGAVNRKYAEADCRFDYRLTYRTADDYLAGRERFETMFYPAGRRRVQ